MNSDFTFIVITGCFWYWTTSKIAITISPLREENRWQKRLANLTFTILVGLQAFVIIEPNLANSWLISFASAGLVTTIMIASKCDAEGFWSKTRNQIVGTITLLGLAAVIPTVCDNPSVIPAFYAIVVAHSFHKAQLRLFGNSLKDLDSIKTKVNRLQADLANQKIKREATEAAYLETSRSAHSGPTHLKAMPGGPSSLA